MRVLNFLQVIILFSVMTVIIAVDLYKVLDLTSDASD